MRKFNLKLVGSMLTLLSVGIFGANTAKADLVDVIPAPGSELAGLMEGETMKFKFNEQGATYRVDLLDAQGIFWATLVNSLNDQLPVEDGYYVKTFGTDYIFEEGCEYNVVFNLYKSGEQENYNLVGSQTVTYKGSSEKLGSTVSFLGATPAVGSMLTPAADGSVTVSVVFSAPVEVSATVPIGMGVGLPVQAKAVTPDNKMWSITVPESELLETMNAYERLQISVEATDEYGKLVYEDGLPYISLFYSVDIEIVKGKEFSVDIAGKTVTGPVEYFMVASADSSLPIYPNDVNSVTDEGIVNLYQTITVTAADGTIMSDVETIWTMGPDGEEVAKPFDGTVTLSTPITLPGTYSIHFPYGAFTIGEETLGDYSVEKTVEFTISSENLEAKLVTPAMEGQEMLYAMQVVWGDGATLNYPVAGTSRISANLTLPSGETEVVSGRIAIYIADEGEGGVMTLADGDNSLLFQFMDPYSQPGLYTLTIPAGTVLVEGVANSEAEVSYRLGEAANTMGYATVLDPQSEFLNSCLSATLTWDMQEITLAENANISVKVDMNTYTMDELDVYLTDAVGTDDPGVAFHAEGEGVHNALVINLPMLEVWGKTGEFSFIIPEGTVINAEGAVNPAQVVTVYVLPTTDVAITVTPDCGNFESVTVKELKEVTLTWDGMEVTPNAPCEVRLNVDNDEIYLYNAGLVSIDEETNTVVLDVAELCNTDGSYEIVVPEGAFVIGGENNMALSSEGCYTYIVSGSSKVAEFVAAEGGRYVVYNAAGVKMLDTENAADLKSLAKGLYIVNNQKVMVTGR